MDGVRVGSGLTGESPKKLPPFPSFPPPPQFFTPPPLFRLPSEPRLIRLAEKPLSFILRPSLLFCPFFLSLLPRPSAGSFPLHPGKELLELLTRNEVQQRTTTGFFYSSSLLHPSIWVESGQKSGGDRLRSPFGGMDLLIASIKPSAIQALSSRPRSTSVGVGLLLSLWCPSIFFFAGGQFFCQVDFWRQTLWRRQRYKTRESRRASIFPPPLSPFFARRCTYVRPGDPLPESTPPPFTSEWQIALSVTFAECLRF